MIDNRCTASKRAKRRKIGRISWGWGRSSWCEGPLKPLISPSRCVSGSTACRISRRFIFRPASMFLFSFSLRLPIVSISLIRHSARRGVQVWPMHLAPVTLHVSFSPSAMTAAVTALCVNVIMPVISAGLSDLIGIPGVYNYMPKWCATYSRLSSFLNIIRLPECPFFRLAGWKRPLWHLQNTCHIICILRLTFYKT